MRGRHINLFIVYSPLFKRVFSFITPLFYLFQYLPLFLVARTTISKKVTLFLCFYLICLILRGASFDHISRTLVGIWPLVFFYKLNFSITQKNMSIFVLLVIFYGLLQRIFGFFPYELFWLETYSNVGTGYPTITYHANLVFLPEHLKCVFHVRYGLFILKTKTLFYAWYCITWHRLVALTCRDIICYCHKLFYIYYTAFQNVPIILYCGINEYVCISGAVIWWYANFYCRLG